MRSRQASRLRPRSPRLKGLLSMQEQPSYDQLEERKFPGGPDDTERTRIHSALDSLHLQRPKFMEKRGLTPAERGTAYHTVMQTSSPG